MRYKHIIEANWGSIKRGRTMHRQDVAWIFYTLGKFRDHQRLRVFGSITKKEPNGAWFPISDVDVAYLIEDFDYGKELPGSVSSDLRYLRTLIERYRDEFDFFLVAKNGLFIKTDNGGIGRVADAAVQQEAIEVIHRTGIPYDQFVVEFQRNYFPEGFSEAVMFRSSMAFRTGSVQPEPEPLSG